MTGAAAGTFGRNLARHRQTRHWTFRQAAQASGVGFMVIHRAEHGASISVFSAARLAAAYGTTLDALLTETPEAP